MYDTDNVVSSEKYVVDATFPFVCIARLKNYVLTYQYIHIVLGEATCHFMIK